MFVCLFVCCFVVNVVVVVVVFFVCLVFSTKKCHFNSHKIAVCNLDMSMV